MKTKSPNDGIRSRQQGQKTPVPMPKDEKRIKESNPSQRMETELEKDRNKSRTERIEVEKVISNRNQERIEIEPKTRRSWWELPNGSSDTSQWDGSDRWTWRWSATYSAAYWLVRRTATRRLSPTTASVNSVMLVIVTYDGSI